MSCVVFYERYETLMLPLFSSESITCLIIFRICSNTIQEKGILAENNFPSTDVVFVATSITSRCFVGETISSYLIWVISGVFQMSNQRLTLHFWLVFLTRMSKFLFVSINANIPVNIDRTLDSKQRTILFLKVVIKI